MEEWVDKWEGNGVEGWEEGRGKETLSFLVVCINTHTAMYTTKI